MGRKTIAKKVAPPREGKTSSRVKDVKVESVTWPVVTRTVYEFPVESDPNQLKLF